jgi:hypothetical protein
MMPNSKVMNIFHQAALEYHVWGANVSALQRGSKAPIGSWQRWKNTRQSINDVNNMPWNAAAGVGYFPGIGDWHDFDLDHAVSDAPLIRILHELDLPDNYSWIIRTGSGNGWRIVFCCLGDLPPVELTPKQETSGIVWGRPITAGDFDHLELRWRNCHSILAPAEHPTGPGYTFVNGEPFEPPALVSAEQVQAAYHAVATEVDRGKQQPAGQRQQTKRKSRPLSETRPNENAIRECFDLRAYAEKHFPGEHVREGSETRIKGNGGLLINAEKGTWFSFRDDYGGDAIELCGYHLYGAAFDHNDATQYRAALKEAADFAGVTLVDSHADHKREKHSIAVTRTPLVPYGLTASARPTSSEYVASLTALGHNFRFNELTQDVEVNSMAMTDILAAQIRSQMRDVGYNNMRAIEDAYVAAASENTYHPIKDYLDSLHWDGVDHIGELADCLQDNHDKFNNGDSVARRFLQRWLIGSVGKVFAQEQVAMLVLEGGQNLGKSRLVHWLASPLPAYFVEGPIDPDDKDCHIRLMSRWIWEVSELGATTRRADIEALKSFITQRHVTVRKPYGKHDVRAPAVCSLIGTLNDTGAGFLNDSTGSRRSMTISLARIDWSYGDRIDVNQVWAQAVALFRTGESPSLTEEERKMQSAINATFESVDPVEDVLMMQFEIDPSQTTWFTPSAEILRIIDETLKGTSVVHAHAIAAILKKRGLAAARKREDGQQPRGYRGIRPRALASSRGCP